MKSVCIKKCDKRKEREGNLLIFNAIVKVDTIFVNVLLLSRTSIYFKVHVILPINSRPWPIFCDIPTLLTQAVIMYSLRIITSRDYVSTYHTHTYASKYRNNFSQGNGHARSHVLLRCWKQIPAKNVLIKCLPVNSGPPGGTAAFGRPSPWPGGLGIGE